MNGLTCAKVTERYRDESLPKAAQREAPYRSLNMLIGCLWGDIFQHWMYTHPAFFAFACAACLG